MSPSEPEGTGSEKGVARARDTEQTRPPHGRSTTASPLFAVLRIALSPFVFAFNVVAALVVLFEEWGWRPLARFMAWLATFSPWAAVERWIASLPPYPSLLVFAVPSIVLFPLKFASLWLVAEGRLVAAGALFAGAKVASTAWVARVFMLTKPTLMRIGWFARAYGWFMPWKEHLFGLIRASWVWRYGRVVKTRLRRAARRFVDLWRPVLHQRTQRMREIAKAAIIRIRQISSQRR